MSGIESYRCVLCIQNVNVKWYIFLSKLYSIHFEHCIIFHSDLAIQVENRISINMSLLSTADDNV